MLLPLAAPGAKGASSLTWPTDADSVGVVVTSGASNAMGTWVTMLDPTPSAIYGIHVLCTQPATSRHVLFDVGVAPTGTTTYTVVAGYLPSDYPSTSGHWTHIYVPVYVPEGYRVGVRNQGATSGTTGTFSMMFQAGGAVMESAFQEVVPLGATAATTRGTTLDSGATANTKPTSWTTLSASTDRPYRAIMLMPTWFITSTATRYFNVDVGVGAAASEVAVIQNAEFEFHASRDQPAPLFYGPYPCHIPAGARVSARTSSNTATAADRVIDVIAYGCV